MDTRRAVVGRSWTLQMHEASTMTCLTGDVSSKA